MNECDRNRELDWFWIHFWIFNGVLLQVWKCLEKVEFHHVRYFEHRTKASEQSILFFCFTYIHSQTVLVTSDLFNGNTHICTPPVLGSKSNLILCEALSLSLNFKNPQPLQSGTRSDKKCLNNTAGKQFYCLQRCCHCTITNSRVRVGFLKTTVF